MRTFLIILLTAFCIHFASGQHETYRDVPGLLQKIAAASTDTARILLKCKLAEAYRTNKPDTSLTLATEALSVSTERKFKKGVVHALVVLCVLHREKGDLPYALELGLKALKMAEDEQMAFENIYSLIRVANVYLSVKDITKAVNYLKKAEGLLKNNHDEFQWAVTQYFLGEAYNQLNDMDAAEKQVQLLELKYPSEPIWIIVTKRMRASFADKKNQWPLAIIYYRESNKIAIAEIAFREAATNCNAMASVFKKMGQTDSAIFYAKQGLQFGEMLDYKNRILAASSLLAELYADKDPKEAVRYYKISSATKDSLYGMQKVQQLQSATIKEQERQSEIEAERLAYRNKMRQWAFLGGSAVFLVIAIILLRNNRQKQKTNKFLESTLTNLRNTQSQLIQSEKMVSLGELTAGIAHEIQNPLNFVNNFSEVNAELIAELKEEVEKGNIDEVKLIAGDIEENEKKIIHHGKRADAIVKGMLQHSRSSSGVKEPTDINALADEYLRLAYHGLRAKDKTFNATMKTDFDKTIGLINIIPQDIGRVILNLINNAFYALSTEALAKVGSDYTPTVIVKTALNPPSGGRGAEVLISVRDNGPGIPKKFLDKIFQPFFTTKPTGQGTGLGLSLSYDIVKAHGGELKVKTKEGEGAAFIIELPI